MKRFSAWMALSVLAGLWGCGGDNKETVVDDLKNDEVKASCKAGDARFDEQLTVEGVRGKAEFKANRVAQLQFKPWPAMAYAYSKGGFVQTLHLLGERVDGRVLTEKDLLSPMHKYDAAFSELTQISAVSYEEKNRGRTLAPEGEAEGEDAKLANMHAGSVVASMLWPEPRYGVTVNDVWFSTADVKALLAASCEGARAVYIGGTCNGKAFQLPAEGAGIDSACNGLGAMEFHQALVTMIALDRRAFGMTREGDRVEHRAVFGYRVVEWQESGSDVEVKIEIDAMPLIEPGRENEMTGIAALYPETLTYHYKLSFSGEGDLVNSEWLDTQDLPSAIWLPLRPETQNGALVPSLLDRLMQLSSRDLSREQIEEQMALDAQEVQDAGLQTKRFKSGEDEEAGDEDADVQEEDAGAQEEDAGTEEDAGLNLGSPAEDALSRALAAQHETIYLYQSKNILRIDEQNADGTKGLIKVDLGQKLLDAYLAFEVEHAYVNDLELSLQHGEQSSLLHKEFGGCLGRLSQTRALMDFRGADAAGDWILQVIDRKPDLESAANNRLVNMELQLSVGEPVYGLLSYLTRKMAVHEPILDMQTLESSISVDFERPVRGVTVEIEGKHKHTEDLKVWLTHGHQSQLLHQGEGSSEFHWKFSSDVWNGTASRGDWILSIADEAELDEGELTTWTLQILQ